MFNDENPHIKSINQWKIFLKSFFVLRVAFRRATLIYFTLMGSMNNFCRITIALSVYENFMRPGEILLINKLFEIMSFIPSRAEFLLFFEKRLSPVYLKDEII